MDAAGAIGGRSVSRQNVRYGSLTPERISVAGKQAVSLVDAAGATRGQSVSRQDVRYGSSKREQGSRSRSKSP
eukprot:4252838-Prorocentrum_lima.AAC.1